MTTAKELQEEFYRKLKKLQEECNHPELTDWLMEEWAPGHGTGYKVRQCKVCWKIVERKEA